MKEYLAYMEVIAEKIDLKRMTETEAEYEMARKESELEERAAAIQQRAAAAQQSQQDEAARKANQEAAALRANEEQAARPQQVNNGAAPAEPSRARETESEQNKPSESGNELLPDRGTSATAGGVDPQVEAVGEIDGANVRRG